MGEVVRRRIVSGSIAGCWIAAAIVAVPIATWAKPPDIGGDSARSAWVKSQTDANGKSCCGEGDGRLVDSRVIVSLNSDEYRWQVKIYRTLDGHWLFGIPEEAQIIIDPIEVEADPTDISIGWLDVPHHLETDISSFTGKAFAWWSIAYNRIECFRKPAGY